MISLTATFALAVVALILPHFLHHLPLLPEAILRLNAGILDHSPLRSTGFTLFLVQLTCHPLDH